MKCGSLITKSKINSTSNLLRHMKLCIGRDYSLKISKHYRAVGGGGADCCNGRNMVTDRIVGESSNEVIDSDEVDIFIKPARILISGYSGSGKSFFTGLLIKKYLDKFSQVIISGSTNFPVIKHPKIKFSETVFDPFQDEEISSGKSHTLLVYDDLMFDLKAQPLLAKIFSKCRHSSISAIYLSQNLYFQNTYYRAIALNCSFFVLLKSRDIAQVAHFSRSTFSKEQQASFMQTYRESVENVEYGHLLIDFTKSTSSKLRVRGNVVGPDPEFCVEL